VEIKSGFLKFQLETAEIFRWTGVVPSAVIQQHLRAAVADNKGETLHSGEKYMLVAALSCVEHISHFGIYSLDDFIISTRKNHVDIALGVGNFNRKCTNVLA
jgi:hypothetical protein